MAYEEKLGMFSFAGIVSGEKYNILKQFHKIKERVKIAKYKDSYYPDKEYLDNLKGKKNINKDEILKEVNIFNAEELKNEIAKNNIYNIGEEEKDKKNNELINPNAIKEDYKKTNFLQENKIIKLLNKKQLYSSKKYKYHNEHMKRVDKYKQEGIYKKILEQQANGTIYNPKMDYIFKKIKSGPKWEKLSGRDYLLYDNSKNKNKTEKNLSSYDNKNIKSLNIFPRLKKRMIIKTNFTTISRNNKKIKTNIKNINDISSDNIKNNKTIKTFDSNQNKNKKVKSLDNIKKREYLHGPDFSRYLDLEKVERKKKRLQKVAMSKIDLMPNYSSIEGDIKTFVNYNKSRNIIPLKRKIKNFEGINSSEFLYDAGKTYDTIYGHKMKSVPKFYNMIARPNDINLPTFMKGLYSRIGLELSTEKALKMNNYENSKIYRNQSSFGQTHNYRKIRKICYKSDIDAERNKIKNDLNIIKRNFNKIKTISYD